EDQAVTFIYEKVIQTGSVILKYQDINGKQIKEDTQISGEVGEVKDVDTADIDGYKFKQIKENIINNQITIDSEEKEIHFIYAKKVMIQLSFVGSEGGEAFHNWFLLDSNQTDDVFVRTDEDYDDYWYNPNKENSEKYHKYNIGESLYFDTKSREVYQGDKYSIPDYSGVYRHFYPNNSNYNDHITHYGYTWSWGLWVRKNDTPLEGIVGEEDIHIIYDVRQN
ncbi:MucBP domain-containing protein, partial [Enterococcus faecalis]|uniref:MucBP domain-containing protein n=1 Tax=Enterococcus faecalis TaxID=1351 RepID=UPI00035273B4